MAMTRLAKLLPQTTSTTSSSSSSSNGPATTATAAGHGYSQYWAAGVFNQLWMLLQSQLNSAAYVTYNDDTYVGYSLGGSSSSNWCASSYAALLPWQAANIMHAADKLEHYGDIGIFSYCLTTIVARRAEADASVIAKGISSMCREPRLQKLLLNDHRMQLQQLMVQFLTICFSSASPQPAAAPAAGPSTASAATAVPPAGTATAVSAADAATAATATAVTAGGTTVTPVTPAAVTKLLWGLCMLPSKEREQAFAVHNHLVPGTKLLPKFVSIVVSTVCFRNQDVKPWHIPTVLLSCAKLGYYPHGLLTSLGSRQWDGLVSSMPAAGVQSLALCLGKLGFTDTHLMTAVVTRVADLVTSTGDSGDNDSAVALAASAVAWAVAVLDSKELAGKLKPLAAFCFAGPGVTPTAAAKAAAAAVPMTTTAFFTPRTLLVRDKVSCAAYTSSSSQQAPDVPLRGLEGLEAGNGGGSHTAAAPLSARVAVAAEGEKDSISDGFTVQGACSLASPALPCTSGAHDSTGGAPAAAAAAGNGGSGGGGGGGHRLLIVPSQVEYELVGSNPPPAAAAAAAASAAAAAAAVTAALADVAAAAVAAAHASVAATTFAANATKAAAAAVAALRPAAAAAAAGDATPFPAALRAAKNTSEPAGAAVRAAAQSASPHGGNAAAAGAEAKCLVSAVAAAAEMAVALAEAAAVAASQAAAAAAAGGGAVEPVPRAEHALLEAGGRVVLEQVEELPGTAKGGISPDRNAPAAANVVSGVHILANGQNDGSSEACEQPGAAAAAAAAIPVPESAAQNTMCSKGDSSCSSSRGAGYSWSQGVAASVSQRWFTVHTWLKDAPELLGKGGLAAPGFLTGREVQMCTAAWQKQRQDPNKLPTSQFQREVQGAARALPGLEVLGAEVLDCRDGAFSIDVVAVTKEGQLLAIEADGPHHFMSPSNRVTSYTRFRDRGLEKRGYVVVNVPWYYWEKLEKEMEFKQQFLESCIKAAVAGRGDGGMVGTTAWNWFRNGRLGAGVAPGTKKGAKKEKRKQLLQGTKSAGTAAAASGSAAAVAVAAVRAGGPEPAAAAGGGGCLLPPAAVGAGE